jgi:hypothetical protein
VEYLAQEYFDVYEEAPTRNALNDLLTAEKRDDFKRRMARSLVSVLVSDKVRRSFVAMYSRKRVPQRWNDWILKQADIQLLLAQAWLRDSTVTSEDVFGVESVQDCGDEEVTLGELFGCDSD